MSLLIAYMGHFNGECLHELFHSIDKHQDCYVTVDSLDGHFNGECLPELLCSVASKTGILWIDFSISCTFIKQLALFCKVLILNNILICVVDE